MAKVISFQSRKGGTGKTTSALTFAQIVASKGYKVLLVDADEQANTTRRFTDTCKKDFKQMFSTLKEDGIGHPLQSLTEQLKDDKYARGTYDVLIDPTGIRKCIYGTNHENLYLCPANEELIKADQMVLLDTRSPQQTRFSRAFKIIANVFDYIVIDNAPSANMTIINSLFASDLVIITLKAGGDELDGLRKTLADISEINENFGVNINFKILMTMMHRQKRNIELLEREALEAMFPDRLFKTMISYQDAAVAKSSVENRSLLDKKSNVLNDYKAFVDEFLKGGAD
ncbi:MAG TPA: ParA family protein [Candidatus Fimiplasma intestinipullorum]|uniref:ParA family protein n=1 Tax=Candidatus Fimiplasma intestinipullorum TaxID=2840825 RepID=A0A9D1L0Y0_9FIRM|nr:ParA family protein [Candidatus Fimiplasma intestinipullorum]